MGKTKKTRKTKKKKVSRINFIRKRDKALERVIAAYDADEQDPEVMNMALDALVIAHTAYTFEVVSGPVEW